MIQKIMLVVALVIIVLVAACTKQGVSTVQEKSPVEKIDEQVAQSLDQDVADLNKLTQDLDSSTLESLDQHMTDIQNADM